MCQRPSDRVAALFYRESAPLIFCVNIPCSRRLLKGFVRIVFLFCLFFLFYTLFYGARISYSGREFAFHAFQPVLMLSCRYWVPCTWSLALRSLVLVVVSKICDFDAECRHSLFRLQPVRDCLRARVCRTLYRRMPSLLDCEFSVVRCCW